MSGLLALLGSPPSGADRALAAMASAAPHRGQLQWLRVDCGWLGVQERKWGSASSRPGLAARGSVAVATVGGLSRPHVSAGRDAARWVLDYYEEHGSRWNDDHSVSGDLTFVLWDAAHQRAWLHRDAMGLRPLYYGPTPSVWSVASEIKQLLVTRDASDIHFNTDGATEWLTGRYSGTQTFYRDIFSMPAAHHLNIQRSTSEIPQPQRHWHPPCATFASTLEHAGQLLRKGLETAVGRHRNEADLGILLSGGLDSTSIAAASVAQRGHGKNATAISAYYPECPQVDESDAIEQVVKQLGLPLKVVHPRLHPFEEIPVGIRIHDGPAFGPMATNLRVLLRFARESNIRILMDGHDGDALLGRHQGIATLLWQRGAFQTLASHLSFLRRRRQCGWTRVLGSFLVNLAWGDSWKRIRRSPMHRCPEWLGDHLRALWKNRYRSPANWYDVQREAVAPHIALGFEFLEREALAAGVELLHPFYDQEIVEFLLSLPPEIKCAGGMPKGVLRHAFAGYLPASVLQQPRKLLFDALYLRSSSSEWILRFVDRVRFPEGWIRKEALARYLANPSSWSFAAHDTLALLLQLALLNAQFVVPSPHFPTIEQEHVS